MPLDGATLVTRGVAAALVMARTEGAIMSFARIPSHLARSGGLLSHLERSVLLAIASYADANGRCWPSIATLMQDSGACHGAAIKAIQGLERKGVLIAERSHGRSTTYKINQEHNPSTAWTSPQDTPVHCMDTSIETTPPVHGMDPTRPRHGHEQTIEHTKEHTVAEPATVEAPTQFELSPPKETKPKSPPPGLMVVSLWNELLPDNGVARLDKRNIRILNRYAQTNPEQWWRDLFTCAQEHPYWSGRGKWGAVPFARILSVEGFDKFTKDIDAMLAADNGHNDLSKLNYG